MQFPLSDGYPISSLPRLISIIILKIRNTSFSIWSITAHISLSLSSFADLKAYSRFPEFIARENFVLGSLTRFRAIPE